MVELEHGLQKKNNFHLSNINYTDSLQLCFFFAR